MFPHPPTTTTNYGKSGVGLGHHVLPLLAAHRQYLSVGQTRVWFPRLSTWKPIHLLKQLETASQQRAAKYEGLGLQSSSHITKPGRNHLHWGGGGGWRDKAQVTLFLIQESGWKIELCPGPSLRYHSAREPPNRMGCFSQISHLPLP